MSITRFLIPLMLPLALGACGQTAGNNQDRAPRPAPGTPGNPAPGNPQAVRADMFRGTSQWTITPPAPGVATQGRIQWSAPSNTGGGFTVRGTRLDCTDAAQAGTCSPAGTAELTVNGEMIELELRGTDQGLFFRGQDNDLMAEVSGSSYKLQGSGSLQRAEDLFPRSADFELITSAP
ncbi:hypothetical protein [Deinococcus peraridilitoris]|uniref:DUF306 domain-containing protein n=1 Tax=Deinococcus peraridilitoris (strain DSM 19664 / LMG 22246 / CIP 109416 / KR-200) TaxID=937777 RepID=L0A1R1_DEIPD|nr:hypothetical protein [Deinococcus peraridilitoris]AFZ67776.1 hypothetical protein Deipe_2295 [Deinococcus peraridilitoris DSM 19664]